MAKYSAAHDKAKYTKQREDAEAQFKKTGKKSATYKSLEKKGYVGGKSAKPASSGGGKGFSAGSAAAKSQAKVRTSYKGAAAPRTPKTKAEAAAANWPSPGMRMPNVPTNKSGTAKARKSTSDNSA